MSRSSEPGSDSRPRSPIDNSEKTLFISDLHLGPSCPDITERFTNFLGGPAREAEAIYILGDLFEAWLGDDAVGTFEKNIACHLRALSQTGTRLAFLHGNRDFLLGANYCSLCGMEVLQQPHVLDLYGTPTVLLHGDQLCTLDDQYQRYRARFSDPDWQRRMLSRPLLFRKTLATLLRGASRLRNRTADSPKMDVVAKDAETLLHNTGAGRMIHGHTHRPFRHTHHVDGEIRERIVLGDWYSQGSVLVVKRESIELQSLGRD